MKKLLYTTNSIESLNYQLRKVTKARGHFPGDDAVVKLLWLAIINIEDKRARERAARRQETGKRSDQPARLIEGQRVMGWREALNELAIAYPDEPVKAETSPKLKDLYTPEVTSSSSPVALAVLVVVHSRGCGRVFAGGRLGASCRWCRPAPGRGAAPLRRRGCAVAQSSAPAGALAHR